jgi:NAD(P)-dependent dehydrogenase (short-subunit alcohol dehydrogenase family)
MGIHEANIQAQPGRAVVTGAASGIGQAIASRLLADGWNVVGLDKTQADQPSAQFRPIVVDLTDSKKLSTVLGQLDGITAIVHAAGFMRTAPLGSLAGEDGAAMWRLHVDVAAAIANVLLPKMGEGGRMVLIGSRTASGAAGRSQYAATKAALLGMARPVPPKRRCWRIRRAQVRHQGNHPSAVSSGPTRWPHSPRSC